MIETGIDFIYSGVTIVASSVDAWSHSYMANLTKVTEASAVSLISRKF